jgi:ubiquinone biosynthesis monooxygenase Coq7
MFKPDLSPIDHALIHFDHALRTLHGRPRVSSRITPAAGIEEDNLDEQQRDDVISMMRINHAGEVAAQGLYTGQALTAHLEGQRAAMELAAMEENDHLEWTASRLRELGGERSRLDPLWFGGALLIGAAAGAVGDRWSLGFVAETERQVVSHLDGHLRRLPHSDRKSRAIIEQMRDDELEHATMAEEGGAKELPPPVKGAMWFASRVMIALAGRV